MIGEFLFRLSSMEAHSAPIIQRVTYNQQPAGVAATLVAVTLLTVPPDKALHLVNIAVSATAGAAQTCDRITVDHYADNGNTFLGRLAQSILSAGLLRHSLDRQFTDLILMPNELVICNAFFSAGGVANTISAAANGLLLPKGNLQLR